MCSADSALSCDVRQSHSPKELEPLEASEREGIMVPLFFEVRGVLWMVLLRDELPLVFL